MTEQFLPIGVQNFEKMRTNNFIYVDKTRYFYDMVRPGQGYYFLSRPRRFGKSLTISTLRCLFQGRKELFDNLWIAKNTQWEWEKHPVVLIDFNQISHDTPESLKAGLESSLRGIGQLNQIQLNESLLKAFSKRSNEATKDPKKLSYLFKLAANFLSFIGITRNVSKTILTFSSSSLTFSSY